MHEVKEVMKPNGRVERLWIEGRETAMACPKCGCKVHYQYNGDWAGAYDGDPCDERLERCAACGEVFDIEDASDEDDE